MTPMPASAQGQTGALDDGDWSLLSPWGWGRVRGQVAQPWTVKSQDMERHREGRWELQGRYSVPPVGPGLRPGDAAPTSDKAHFQPSREYSVLIGFGEHTLRDHRELFFPQVLNLSLTFPVRKFEKATAY